MEVANNSPMPLPGDENKPPVTNPYLSSKSQQQTVPNDAAATAASKNGATSHTPQNQQHQQQSQLQQQQVEEHQSQQHQQHDTIQLLRTLQRDYEELQKTSVKGCLRSKHLPCREVRSLLDKNQLSLALLQKAYETVIGHEDYLGSSRDDTTHACSSLGYMTRIGTAVRLIQVLLLWKENLTESSRMVGGLLQAICSTVEKALQQYNQDSNAAEREDDDKDDLYSGPLSENSHAPQVACFAFAFLLRIKSLVIQHRLDFLSGLWKFLDRLAQGLAPNLPQELLHDAIQALGVYLKDFLHPALGLIISQLTQQQQQPLSDVAQKTKLCLFFFARLASFLKLSATSSVEVDETVAENLMSVLVRFRGLISAAVASIPVDNDIDETSLGPFQKIAGKAEKCLSSLLLNVHRKEEETTSNEYFLLNKTYIQIFLRLEHNCEKAAIPGDIPHALDKASFDIGRVQTVLQVLKANVSPETAMNEPIIPSVWNDEANINALLSLSEHLIFVSLPKCHNLLVAPLLDSKRDKTRTSVLLIQEALHCVSSLLYFCETFAPCMTTNADRGVAALHRLLVRWLLPAPPGGDGSNSRLTLQHHPLTRQFILALVKIHTVHLYCCPDDPKITVDSDMPLLALLAKVFFDARTITEHRSTIATLFRSILTTQSEPLVKRLQCLISDEFRAKTRSSKSAKRRRRPRMRNQRGWSVFCIEDLQVISSVLSLLPVSLLPDAAHVLELFSLKVVTVARKSKRSSKRLRTGSVKTAIVCLSFLEAAVREDPSQHKLLKNMSANQDLFTLLERIVTWFLGYWDAEFAEGRRKHAQRNRTEMLAILGTRILHLIVFSCKQAEADAETSTNVARMTKEQIQKIYQIINTCTEESRVLRLCSTSSLVQAPNQPVLASLVLEASRSLSVLGHIIPRENPEDVLHGIFGLFQRLLGMDACWSLGTYTVSALHELSTTLPRAYKTQLPKCIPKRNCKGLMALLQCRIRGGVYRYEQHKRRKVPNDAFGYYDSSQALLTYCSSKLEETLICRASRIMNSTKPSSVPLMISVGSYFLTMPTQEGRKAVVIFPPGEDSLKDINYMLGMGEEEDGDAVGDSEQEDKPPVRNLKSVVLGQDGSCKMVLNP